MTSALRGRDSEVRAVLALLGRARAGQSGALVIRGEAGTGKTALLDVAAGGMTLLRATAIETEAELPFAGLHLLLRPTLGRLDRVPRPHRTVGYHLYKAYPKLGVSSRAELAALIAAQAR
jgi:AAA ATPase domain